jgi:putative DNA primase/helicase
MNTENFIQDVSSYISVDQYEENKITQLQDDSKEDSLENDVEEFVTEMEERRGVTRDSKGKIIFNCNRFSNYCRNRVRIFRMCNTWYIYNYKIGIYECISDSFAKKVFKTIFDEPDTEVWKTGYENQYISALASDVDHLSAIPANPYKVCFKNGIVNLKDGTISNHSPEEIHTVLIPHNYEPNADCPTFKRFISEIMEDDSKRVSISMSKSLVHIPIPTAVYF